MRLSINNYEFRKRFGDKKAIRMLKEAGFDSLDYSYYGKNEILGECYIEHAKMVKAYLQENDMTCNQAHAPYAIQYGCTFDSSDPAYRCVLRSIESAAILGAKCIVVHAINVPAEIDFFEYNYSYYKSLEPYCREHNICVAIENLFVWDVKCRCYRGRLHTYELLHKMIERLNSEWFVVCVDVGHASLVGLEPEELIRNFDNRMLQALHLHDTDYLTDLHTLPYAGSLNWNNIMSALKEIEYSGDFTLETPEYFSRIDDEMIEDALRFAALTGRHLMKKLGGDSRYGKKG